MAAVTQTISPEPFWAFNMESTVINNIFVNLMQRFTHITSVMETVNWEFSHLQFSHATMQPCREDYPKNSFQ